MGATTSTIPADVRGHRYLQLDSLRGLAALTVVFHHFFQVWPARYRLFDETPLRFLTGGHEAVIFFFVLSGFVLSVPFSGTRPPKYRVYLAKRFCRIYLPYVAALLLAIAGDALFFSTVKTHNGWIDQTWASRPSPALFGQVLLTSIHGAQQVNTAMWTLALEIRISIIFPLLYWIARRFGVVVPVAALALGCALNQALHVLGMETVMCLSTAMLFLLGIGLHQHLAAVSSFVSRLGKGASLCLLVLALLMFEAPGAVMAHRGVPFSASVSALKDLVAGLGAAWVMVWALKVERFRQWLMQPALVRLGSLSYSTYLIHGTVLFVLIRLFYGKPFFLSLFPVYLLLVYGISELFHKWVDQPAVLIGRRVGRRLETQAESKTVTA